ncbi:WYL domain-containing protein [Paenibacillus sp.]|jgi:predicted DNA-binding transcriptional regulator YafY|uniref:helix-turn-helix transcriptional regulator n=1 Tax=Paenibacillus sp. TaxID=58172 RepID=UPI0028206235|nr:WYL domain-containing protein [Paenibacillus sp.]MDR0268574.1 WYL domain-containing protein [Paenibacillus sp.]
MSNMHRIHWFDQMIREGHYPNSKDMALQFEISRRQAQRDIEYLAISLRAPLLYIAKHRGYCYEDAAYVLPHLYITEEEKSVLKFLARKYGQYSSDNPAGVQRVAHLLGRFAGEEGDGAASHLPFFEADPHLIQISGQLSFAIAHHKVVHLHYRHEGEETRLDICPTKLVSKYNADYVAAFASGGGRLRLFRLDEIIGLQITPQVFTEDEVDCDVFEQSGTPMLKPFTARIKLHSQLRENSWYGYAARPVGEHLYDVDFYDADTFMQQLLLAPWVRLDSPKWLKARLRDQCVKVLKHLDGEGES